MRLAFIADLHIWNHRRFGGTSEAGINARAREGLDVLSRALARAVELGAAATFILGDVFEGAKPEPQLVAAVMALLREAKVVIIPGNHDQASEAPDDHALGPLAAVAHVVDEPDVVTIELDGERADVVVVPFRSTDVVAVVEAALAGVRGAEAARTSPRILALHAGLLDADTPVYLREAPDAIALNRLVALCKGAGVRDVFAGHWHKHKQWFEDGVCVTQVGTLCPADWCDDGLIGYGTLAVWDTEIRELTIEELPGPRFLRGRNAADVEALRGLAARGNRVYLRMTAEGTALMDDTVWIAEAKRQGLLIDGEALPDEQAATVAARSAATLARSATTLDEAVAVYVREMPLPEDVVRDDVLAAARGYLGRA